MKLRALLAAAGVGAAAVGNRALGRAGGDLPPALSGDQHAFRWRGMDVAYAALGDPDAPSVVLYHDVGVVGTSREFAAVAASLAADYRVFVPDLPGYGRSDRPPLTYSASLYEAFVADFAADVPEATPSIVASGRTGAYATLAAQEIEVDWLALLCPTAVTREHSIARRSAVRSPVLGTAIYNGLTSTAGLQHWVAREQFYGPPPADYLEYLWRSAHQPGARYAPASAMGGHLDPEIDLADAFGDVSAPITLIWGREATSPPLADGRSLAESTDSRLVVVDFAKRLPHIEHADETLLALEEAFSRTTV